MLRFNNIFYGNYQILAVGGVAELVVYDFDAASLRREFHNCFDEIITRLSIQPRGSEYKIFTAQLRRVFFA